MTSFRNRIDVHHHLIPPAFTAAASSHGLTEVAGARLPHWSAEKSLATMDMHGIGTALLSLSAPGVYFGNLSEARTLARSCNEFAADLAARHPGRFGSFAVLPMPFTQHACEEAAFALDELGADGIVLLGSTEGKFLGDAQFDELMAELDRREAVVFVHPNLHKTSTELDLTTPGYLVEFLCDTTRAATNLILSGTMEKYSRIRWILAHAGGFLPYIAWRLSLANEMPSYKLAAPEGVLHYVRRFYYDTALSPSHYALSALRQLVDADHILFGSDYPFAPAVVTGMETAALDALSVLSPEDKLGIDRSHALALFPRFGGLPTPEIPAVHLAQAELLKPVEKLGEWLRNK